MDYILEIQFWNVSKISSYRCYHLTFRTYWAKYFGLYSLFNVLSFCFDYCFISGVKWNRRLKLVRLILKQSKNTFQNKPNMLINIFSRLFLLNVQQTRHLTCPKLSHTQFFMCNVLVTVPLRCLQPRLTHTPLIILCPFSIFLKFLSYLSRKSSLNDIWPRQKSASNFLTVEIDIL